MAKWQVTIAVAVMTGTIGLGAQRGSPAADEKELQQYRLTADALSKVSVAAQAFANDPAMKKWQDAKREAEALDKKEELTAADERRLEQLEAVLEKKPYDFGVESGMSLSAMAAQVAKIPTIASGLKTAGLTPRDFSKFMVVLTQAAMVDGVQKSGVKMALPPGVSAENVRFAADHQAEIERVIKLFDVSDR